MLKLVRLGLTAAIVTAIVVRLRRRARMPEAAEPVPTAPEPALRMRLSLEWAVIAAAVALTLTAALLPWNIQGNAEGAAEASRHDEAQQAVFADVEEIQASATPWQPQPSEPPAAIPDPACAPAPRPVTVRPIDPKVRRAVDRQWRRIERWLKANAPRTYRTLQPPGRARTIAVAESQMGVDFPDDLRASLLRHNGARGVGAFGFGFDGAFNLGTRGIRDSWREMCSWEPAGAGQDPATELWNGRMIPFLYFPGRGPDALSYAVADSADGGVRWNDAAKVSHGAASYHSLMRAVADALERNQAYEGRRPAVERGVLRWENAG
ncbi:SMI1/KNR4 family protein [Nonomuraea sp. NPDC050643]|uniref:SMI1/KNR4 family protein n=1 Tax=Nonomuraea sp. NPDC050643 TaxID=3155660 RepID=UPI0033F6D6CE